MEGKKLRMRAARLLAVVYVMYVVMSGMAIPGTDGSIKPLLRAKAAANLNYVNVANNEVLRAAKVGTVSATNASEGTKITYLTPNKSADSSFIGSQYVYNIYSVRYNGEDYYYDPANNGDGTKEGLFYSDSLNKWGFAFPQSAAGPFEISVQVAVELTATQKKVNIYDKSFTSSAETGGYEQISSGTLGTELDTKLQLFYYNYDGAYKNVSCSSSGVFSTSNLKFYCLTKETDHYTYHIQYGGSQFLYQGDINNPVVLQLWTTETGTASAYRQPGTNRLVVDTNIPDAQTYLQLTAHWSPAGNLTGKYAASLTYNNSNGTFTGTKCTFPEEGFYIPGDNQSSGYSYFGTGRVSVGNTIQGVDITAPSIKWKGPKTSTLGTLEAGDSKNITDNLKDVSNAVSDYAGNVIKVDSTAVTQDTPYSDDYVTIDYFGNVTAKKASGSQKTYKLTTQTQYTKMTYKDSGSYTFIGYEDANGNFSYEPTGVYGTQDWSVSLTVTTTASTLDTEATTTTEPTTAAPVTYKATLSTTNSQTKIAAGSQSATGNSGSITLEAGQTVTVTPGASTYGSTVTVNDSATTVTKNSNGTYTFTMPAKAITVTVTDITLSSITATITGTGKTASSPYAFGAKTAAPTSTEIVNACKQGNPSITANLSDGTTTPVTASQATYSVTTNTLGTATVSGDTITYPGTAVITVTYGGKSTTVNYYYTYTTANQKTLNSISIAAKTNSVLSTSSSAPTVYEAQSELPSEAVIKEQIGTITATYTDLLGNTSTETIANTAAGMELQVTTQTKSATVANGVYTHDCVSQITATYNGKTSNTVSFYYRYYNYSVTCNTVDDEGVSISSVKASVSPATDVAKGTSVTITTPEDTSLSYLMTKISVIGISTNTDYSATVSNKSFAMPGEPVAVTVTYTKLSGYTVTPPTETKLTSAPTQQSLYSKLNGAYLIPEYQSTKGSKVDLTSTLVTVTLGETTETFKNGVSTYTVPVTVTFNGIKKENAFSFTYEIKHTYNVNVVQAAGPSVQLKKDNSYTTGMTGLYYGDIITVKIPEETKEYAFPTVTIKSETNAIIKTVSQPGEVTFTMPAENVTVVAEYQRLTELIVVAPDTSDGNYSSETTKEDLPLGTITAVYGSNSHTKPITMTHSMYSLGEPEEITEEHSDGSSTVTTTVPVTIHVEYGEISKSVTFSYSYSYEVSQASKKVSIGDVTCGEEQLDDSGLVRISRSVADPGSIIRVTVKETPEYAFPTVWISTTSGLEVVSLSAADDEKTGTFTMPEADVQIVVDYKPLANITLTEPDKKQYDQYTNPEDLDFTGGYLTATYGNSEEDAKTISLVTEAGVSNGCTFTCVKGTATEDNGVLVIPVTVTVSYGGKSVSYQYTYNELRTYSIILDEQSLPEDFANKKQVQLSTTVGNYNDKLILSLPADTDDYYAFPTVTVKRGEEIETWEAEDGIYETVITDNMVVSVSYCKLKELVMTLPEECDIETSLIPINALDTSDVKLELVYYNDEEQEGGRRSISTHEYASFAYGNDTESVTDGECIHTVPVLVTANYKDLVEAEGAYFFRYRNYVVSAQDVDGNSLPVDKSRGNAGDTIVISLTSGLDVQNITAGNTMIGYVLSADKKSAMITLSEQMRTDKMGYVFVVAYKTVQGIMAPEEAVLVSDKIMTEEELKQALADLSTFDFGTASILVSYDIFEPLKELPLNSPSVTKELLENKTTEKESADGTYIERTYVILATIDGVSEEVSVIVKVEKKQEDVGGDNPEEGTEQRNPGENTTEDGQGAASSGDDTENPVTVTTPAKPGKVTGVKVTAKKRKLAVTWKAADNATAYEIWVSTKKNGGYLKAATVKKSGSKKTYSYTVKKLDDSKLKKGKTYYVKVRAVNVKSKLATKTVSQTAKSKKNKRLYVTVKTVKNAVSYTVKASTKKKSGYKTIFKFNEIGKKKYTKFIKNQKPNKKYYIKVEVKVETGTHYEGSYSSIVKGKCK